MPQHAEVARANIARAGLADRVEVIVGPALDTLPTLDGPFDLVFIDADKRSQARAYLDRGAAAVAARHRHRLRQRRARRPGRRRRRRRSAASPASARFFDRLGAEPRLTGTAVQTVGVKGWDGFAIALVDDRR